MILPGIDRQASDEPHDDRHRRRRGGTSAEETPVFGWRDEIAHPRVPGAAADRRRALVNGKRPDQRHDAGLRSEQRCNRRSQQQTASDAGGPDADAAAGAPALDQQNRRNLQQLRQEWDRRQHADGEIAGAERDRKTDEEDSGSQRPHRLVGERIIEDEAGGPLGHVRARPAETTRIVVDIGVQHCSSSFARGGEIVRS